MRKASHCGRSNNRDHVPQSLYYCVFVRHKWMLFFAHIPFVVNHAYNANQRRGCNNIPSLSQWTAPIARSFCEGCTWHDLHILVTAPFLLHVSLSRSANMWAQSVNLIQLFSTKERKRYSGSRLLETRSRQGIWEVTLYNLLSSTLASRLRQHLPTINTNGDLSSPRWRDEHIAENGRSVSQATTR